MRLRLVAGRENSGAFERDIDAKISVRQIARILNRSHLDGTATGIQCVAMNCDGVGEPAMDAIEAEQVRIGFNRAEIVDRDDFNIGAPAFDDGAQHVAADPTEAVDRDLDCHSCLLFVSAAGQDTSVNAAFDVPQW